MRAASQIPRRGPTDVDDYDDMMSTSHKKALLTRKTYVKYQRSKSLCQRLLKFVIQQNLNRPHRLAHHTDVPTLYT